MAYSVALSAIPPNVLSYADVTIRDQLFDLGFDSSRLEQELSKVLPPMNKLAGNLNFTQLPHNLGFAISETPSIHPFPSSEQFTTFSHPSYQPATDVHGRAPRVDSPKSASSALFSGQRPTFQFGTDSNFSTGRRYSPPSEFPTFRSIEKRYETVVGCLNFHDAQGDEASSDDDSSTPANTANNISLSKQPDQQEQIGRRCKRRKSTKDAANMTGFHQPPLPPEERRRATHIAAERNRRIRLRDAFAELCDIVPGLNQGGWSKKEVLQESAEWLHGLLEGNARLREQLKELTTWISNLPEPKKPPKFSSVILF